MKHNQNMSQGNIDQTLAELSLNNDASDTTSTVNSHGSFHFLKNVHSFPTISQHNDVAVMTNNNNRDTIDDNNTSTTSHTTKSQATDDKESSLSSIMALKMNLNNDTSNTNTLNQRKLTSHPYQYEYFSNDSIANSDTMIDKSNSNYNTNNNRHSTKDSKGKPLSHNSHSTLSAHSEHDPGSGTLIDEDKVINQTVFTQIIKKDMKRKRNDSIGKSNVTSGIDKLTDLTSNYDCNNNNNDKDISSSSRNTTTKPESRPIAPSEEKPMSATAKMMLRLYGDKSQQSRENTREKDYSKDSRTVKIDQANRSKNKESLQPNPSSTNLPEVKKLKTPTNSDLELLKKKELSNNFYKHKTLPKHYAPSSSSSSGESSDDDFQEDQVEVILKWRDQFAGISKCHIAVVSKDIISTLKSLKYHSYRLDKKNIHSLKMKFDKSTNEWYIPNLFLPPGIYKLQFQINNNLVHSDFLPTATDTVGNIVNWFEVLPGYDRIEPYRIEEKSTDSIANSSNIDSDISSTNNYNKINGNNSDDNMDLDNISSYSSSKFNKSATSLTDYAGISRSSSTMSKNYASNLKLSGLYGFTGLESPKIQYSNEIPELFKFDTNNDSLNDVDSNDVDSNDMDKNLNLKINDNFDLTLSKVVELNQDYLFSNIQNIAKMNTEEAEEYFLSKFKVPDLPIYLNSQYLNKNFDNQLNHIIPHVNLKHLLTTSIKDEIICVGCTTRYEGKFVTQVIYAPCNYD